MIRSPSQHEFKYIFYNRTFLNMKIKLLTLLYLYIKLSFNILIKSLKRSYQYCNIRSNNYICSPLHLLIFK